MENELQVYDPRDDGWDDASKEAANTVVRGTLIKFSDGHWYLGQDANPIRETIRLLAIGTAAAWVKWWDGKPAEYRVRKPGEDLPDRDELGDNVAAAWEPGPDGEPRDPWQNTRFVYLLGESAEAYTFSTSSWGGRSAVIELGDQINRMRYAKKGAVPIVELHDAPMKTRFGTKRKPVLKVVDWRRADGSELPDAAPHKAITAEPAKNADMLNDAIPY